MKKGRFRTYFILFLWLTASYAVIAQTAGDYRSIANGAWNGATTWETFNGSAWVATATAPSSANGVITIQSPHTVTITANATIDQVVISSGAMVNWTGGTCTFAAGTGIDLQINGTFWDNRGAATPAIAFSAGATWAMGTNGTLIRSAGNSSNNWQSAYDSGISTIPATANWILRKTGTQTPALSSTNPASGSVYPNLFIENNTATAFGVSFTGSAAPQTIKGNLDIGGSGAGTGIITFTNTNTNATTTLVQGNLTVRNTGATHNYLNNGTGTTIQGNATVNGNLSNNTVINLQGDLQVNGNLSYSGTTSALNFTGTNSQSISGSGTMQVYKASINKSANDVTLNRALTIDNILTLTLGRIISTTTNLLTINNNGSVTVTSPTTNNSFVSGPVRKDGTSGGFTFPVGKGTNYQPLAVSTTTGGAFGTFWTEDFGSGTCASSRGMRVTSYTGSNGMWAETVTTDGGAANTFFVSATEAGMGVGACGDGCIANSALTNRTLHIGNQSTSPAAFFFCPAGDCGAAYDAGLADGTVLTDRRAESPVIDCSAHSNILLSFTYLEGGQGTSDNGQVWYFDGSTWALLGDMAKTPSNCGGASTWTSFSISLPASANNNPNVKIGFRWVNNDDGAGADPSFAVDDVTLAETAPPESFTCEYFPSNPQLAWGTAKEVTIADITPYEYWILDRNVGTANKLVTLAWDNASSIITPAGTQVIKWDGTQWTDQSNGGTTGVASNDPTCTGQSFCGTVTSGVYVTSFSPFTFGIPVPTPLPVELLDFTGVLEQDQTHLKWSTASEKNTSYFLVEKSSDGINFSELGKVAAAGNSSSIRSYQLYDSGLQEGMLYYRLKTIDLDKSYEYSKTVSVDYSLDNKNIRLYPNPTHSKLYLSITDIAHKITELRVTDVTGLVLNAEVLQTNNNTYELSLENYAEGIYFVEFLCHNKKHIQKVIRQ